MPSQDPKTKSELGQPIPKAVIDVAHQTVGVEDQKRFEPEDQISALRSEVEALKSKLRAAGHLAGKEIRGVRRDVGSSVSSHPIATVAAALLGTLLVVYSASLRRGGQPSVKSYRRMSCRIH